MSTTNFTGPLAIFGASPYSDNNLSIAPSVFIDGVMLMDTRYPYDPDSNAIRRGWYGTTRIPVVDQVPSALAANNIAASQTPTSGTALTLVSTTGAGITVGQSIVSGATHQTVNNLLAIDSAMVPAVFGATQVSVSAWNPAQYIERNVRVTSVGNDSTATFTVRGYTKDWFPLTETITGANAGVASGKKAFGYIASVTPGGTLSGSAVTVGTGDVYGFPLRVDTWGYVEIYWNGALITASTGFTAADTTTPATATTGQTTGSYAVQSASDGTKRLQIYVTPSVANVGLCTVNNAVPASNSVGLTGIANFSG